MQFDLDLLVGRLQGKAKQDKAKQDKAKQVKAKQDKAKQGKARQSNEKKKKGGKMVCYWFFVGFCRGQTQEAATLLFIGGPAYIWRRLNANQIEWNGKINQRQLANNNTGSK